MASLLYLVLNLVHRHVTPGMPLVDHPWYTTPDTPPVDVTYADTLPGRTTGLKECYGL